MLITPISCSCESFTQNRHVITYDRVRKSCRYSHHLVSGEIRRHLVNKHGRSAVVVASAACFTEKCEVCPEYPLLCRGGLCHGFFFWLTLQERVILGQNGRKANKNNNDLANLALEQFHTSLFSTHPRM